MSNSNISQLQEEAKQAAYQKWQNAEAEVARLRDQEQDTADACTRAYAEMQQASEDFKQSMIKYNQAWANYRRVRDEANTKIEKLREEFNSKRTEAQDYLDRAAYARDFGEKTEIPLLNSLVKECDGRCAKIKASIIQLAREIEQAYDEAKKTAPEINPARKNETKHAYETCSNAHQRFDKALKDAINKSDNLKADYERLVAELED